MKFKIESKFVNDYLYSQSQKKKEIQNRKRKMRIETEIENGFSKMFSDKIKEYDNQKGENMIGEIGQTKFKVGLLIIVQFMDMI